MTSVIQLQCQQNNSPWGKAGKESPAALYAATAPGAKFQLDECNYAEMQMSTYSTPPLLVLSTNENLQKHINANKEKLMGKTRAR